MRLLPLTLLLAVDLVAASTHKPAEADVDQELAEGNCVDVRRRGRRAHRALARQRVRVCDVHAHVRCCHPGVRGRFAGLDRGLHGRG